MCSFASPLPAAASSAGEGGAWNVLAPLPDPVGYAGMFAAVLSGRLVTGGGSQFPDKPLWLGGAKTYSDRIFVLSRVDGGWVEAPDRLPRPMAHFAFGVGREAVFLAGGCDSGGVLNTAFVLRPKGNGLTTESLPDLPEPRVYSAGIFSAGRFYVAGGQAEMGAKIASSSVWSIEVCATNARWRREPDLPKAAFVGAMAEANGRVLFVGGVGFDAEGRSIQAREVYRLDRTGTRWETLPPMPEPRVGPVCPAPVIDGRLMVIGGYATPFAGERREHPGFSRQTLVFDLNGNAWSAGPMLPHVAPTNRDSTGDTGPAPMVAASGAVWEKHVVVVGGEVRASVRTPSVIALPVSSQP
jgi:N-acetylneuraminate epimerase